MPTPYKIRHAWIVVALTAVTALSAAPASAQVTLPPTPCVSSAVCPGPKPACAHAGTIPTADNVAVIRNATLCLLNVERTKHGLSKLHANLPLRHVATRYAKAMVTKRFFGHVSPSGSTFVQRIQRSSYLESANGYSVGENLAWGAGAVATPKASVIAWMNSPGHRANILKGVYRDIGIGVVLGVPVAGQNAGATYVNEFGQRG